MREFDKEYIDYLNSHQNNALNTALREKTFTPKHAEAFYCHFCLTNLETPIRNRANTATREMRKSLKKKVRKAVISHYGECQEVQRFLDQS